MNFTAYFSDSGSPATGLTPTIQIFRVSDGGDVTPAPPANEMTEIGVGFYTFPFSTVNTEDYVALADSVSLVGAERYAPCISTVQGDVEEILTDTSTTLPSTLSTIDGKVDTLQVDVTFIRGIEGGRWKIDTTVLPHQMIFYNEADVELKRFNLSQNVDVAQYGERVIVP